MKILILAVHSEERKHLPYVIHRLVDTRNDAHMAQVTRLVDVTRPPGGHVDIVRRVWDRFVDNRRLRLVSSLYHFLFHFHDLALLQ